MKKLAHKGWIYQSNHYRIPVIIKIRRGGGGGGGGGGVDMGVAVGVGVYLWVLVVLSLYETIEIEHQISNLKYVLMQEFILQKSHFLLLRKMYTTTDLLRIFFDGTCRRRIHHLDITYINMPYLLCLDDSSMSCDDYSMLVQGYCGTLLGNLAIQSVDSD